MTTRKEQKEQRREQILICALELFVKKGYAATKVSDIAGAAGMSAGLLFHYFESKEALLEELVGMGLNGTQLAMRVKASDPLDFFRNAAREIFAYIKGNEKIKYMFVLMERTQHDDSIPEHIRKLALKVDNIEKSVPLIEEGQRMGCIRSGEPLALSMAFWGAIQGTAVLLAMCADAPVPEPEWYVDILRNNNSRQENVQ